MFDEMYGLDTDVDENKHYHQVHFTRPDGSRGARSDVCYATHATPQTKVFTLPEEQMHPYKWDSVDFERLWQARNKLPVYEWEEWNV